jgi:hypothetical protein
LIVLVLPELTQINAEETAVTPCNSQTFLFPALGSRRVEADFTGGRVSSDGGALLLDVVARGLELFPRLASCFTDHRNPEQIEHSVEHLLAQRIMGIALGYEDLNDHDVLRDDALLATATGRTDPTGARRKRARDKGRALAGRCTLNRLELTKADASRSSRYAKIVYDGESIEQLLLELFVGSFEEAPGEVILDLDATDDPLHGHQEGRFFHGYYRSYCYLPLYIFAGSQLLVAKLRTADRDAAGGSLDEVRRIVAHLRGRWPELRVIVRADSGFARDNLMAWCESNDVDFVLGLARNKRLAAMIEKELEEVRALCAASGHPARAFRELRYRTKKTWTRERRVVAKAEQLPGKPNPRFVVTSLAVDQYDARALYEDLYAARGDMENRIKEQMQLFSDRTSTHTMRANQLRLWFSSFAYVLVETLRRVGLEGTELAKAESAGLRVRLLKIGAVVRVSVRRVHVALSSVFPLQDVFRLAHSKLIARYADVFG